MNNEEFDISFYFKTLMTVNLNINQTLIFLLKFLKFVYI